MSVPLAYAVEAQGRHALTLTLGMGLGLGLGQSALILPRRDKLMQR